MERREKVVKYLIIFLIVIGGIWFIISLTNNSFRDAIFKFNDDSVEIKVGESFPISYTLAENLAINWESDNDSAVAVLDGVITGVGLGDAMIKGTVVKGSESITRECYVSTYYGNKNVSLNEIVVPEGEVFMTVGDSFKIPIEYNPSTAYIKSVDYSSIDNSIASFNGTILAKNTGSTDVVVTINKSISKAITVNVVDKIINPMFSTKINEIQFNQESLSLKTNETKKIEYTVEPEDAYIGSVEWESSDSNVVDVTEDGLLTAKVAGKATIILTINNNYKKEIDVYVGVPVTGIKLNSNPRLVLKVGGSYTIRTTVSPDNASNKKVKYINSNPGVLSVDENGLVRGLNAGSGNVSIATDDGNHQTSVSYVVNPTSGLISGTGNVWGYTSPNDVTPVRADIGFFQKLVSSGKGILNGNVYVYNDGVRAYKYDISQSILTVNNEEILMRMYYPLNADLSIANTFTMMGGVGPGVVNFGAFLGHLDRNRQDMSSSGIIILVSTTIANRYNANHVVLSTEFVKSIVNQKSGVKNAVGGYSGSGKTAGTAANSGIYDRVIICNSYFYANYVPNAKNKEITVYLPHSDEVIDGREGLNYMVSSGYTDVTVVSNFSSVVDSSTYQSKFLIINPGLRPGGKNWSGHGYANIINAKVFSYACR